MAAQLFAADLRIDHVSVAARGLKTLQAALLRQGIASEYGGRHSNRATEMAITAFADGSYLELIAIQPDADPTAVAAHDWAKQLQGDAGPAAWAVRLDDINAERARLNRANIAVSAPEKSGRARPDGVRIEWETAQVGSESRGTFFPFLIRDFTPRATRVFPSGKPTMPGLRGFTRVVIATKDLQASVARFRAAYDWPEPVETNDAAFGARVAVFAGSPVALAAPLDAQSWIAERLSRFGEGPCAYAIGAERKSDFKIAAKSRWAGAEIGWLDSKALGWHLGIE
jgi:glyoxalase-like protein